MGGRYDPWQHATDLEVKVVQRRLRQGLWGYFDAQRRRVVLANDLCQFERRCTLAHELVHAERGDNCGLSERDEELVHLVAAHRLITLEQLTDVLLGCTPGDRVTQADELWVDVPTLRVRLEHLHPSERAHLRRAARRRDDAA